MIHGDAGAEVAREHRLELEVRLAVLARVLDGLFRPRSDLDLEPSPMIVR